MQTKIIPTLNVKTKEEYIKNLRAVEGFTDTVQIDIADGKFTNWKNWHDPIEIALIETELDYELHVMANNPIDELKRWKNIKNITRTILHVELLCGDERCGLEKTANDITKIFDNKIEIGFAVKPETGVGFFEQIEPKPSYIMLLGVDPGKSGQKFNKNILEKIRKIRQMHPTLNIEVDGGVNNHNIDEVIKAGANIICLGSAIFNDKASPQENYSLIEKRIASLTLM
ncbi:MAG: hypothetical protein GF349_02665 [Candidatus Magasanikbacteria bacterium]|nr:hypothetical protein [Candidatus Magasanikbacteria bacterium]